MIRCFQWERDLVNSCWSGQQLSTRFESKYDETHADLRFLFESDFSEASKKRQDHRMYYLRKVIQAVLNNNEANRRHFVYPMAAHIITRRAGPILMLNTSRLCAFSSVYPYTNTFIMMLPAEPGLI
ncbi:hypothetical protein TNCV_2349261 [Trichonephila clavipes]|uniref:Uncharacterized protein n=1 Tax=Trichonephila clavipes TaxID=2585209 RepID=A0A8X6SXR8_TRICX|nr:hypothetical protein TNCV_2349261 [Trichonephila clavipes]